MPLDEPVDICPFLAQLIHIPFLLVRKINGSSAPDGLFSRDSQTTAEPSLGELG
jgi:hypothetical protein